MHDAGGGSGMLCGVRPALALAVIVSVAASVACGSRTDVGVYGLVDAGALDATHGDASPTRDANADAADAADATIHPPDALPPPGTDAGRDSGVDAELDAGLDASAPPDAANDACPSSYPGEGVACSALGAVCGYAQGTCTCFSGVCCGGPATTCADVGVQCGTTTDACGQQIDCGGCPPGETCGGGGVLGECGSLPDGFSCVVRTCNAPDRACGLIGDGCGGELDCGACSIWGCSPAVPGCPAEQPAVGSACAPEGTQCNYELWLHNCCYVTLGCKGGAWVDAGGGCPG
jgi:hypothetical protein